MIQKSRITVDPLPKTYTLNQMYTDQRQVSAQATRVNSLKAFNLCLRWLIALLALGVLAYFVVGSYQSTKSIKNIELRTQSDELSKVEEQVPATITPLFIRTSRRKNIFMHFEDELNAGRSQRAVVEEPVVVPLTDLIELTGIIIDQPPVAVIKDLKNKETLFLNIGQDIHSAEVRTITQQQVDFLYDNAIIELQL